MDWRAHGLISRSIKAGALRGEAGECVYIPLPRPEGEPTQHLLLVGGGTLPRTGRRGILPEASVEALRRNLLTLGIPGMGISRRDIGEIELKGAPFLMVD